MNEGPIMAVVPARAKDLFSNGLAITVRGRPLLQFTIDHAKSSKRIGRVMVTTDSPEVQAMAQQLGADAPFLRPAPLAARGVPLDDVVRDALQWLQANEHYRPERIVMLEPSHPFRPSGMADRLVALLDDPALDTAFCVDAENDAFWKVDDEGNLHRVGHGDRDTRQSRDPLYRELAGLGLVTRAHVALAGKLLGDRVGVLAVPRKYALIDTQSPGGLRLAETVPSDFFSP